MAAVSSIIFVLLAATFIGIGASEIYAQGTNATNATGTSGGGGQVTVVMPAGSSAATSGGGY